MPYLALPRLKGLRTGVVLCRGGGHEMLLRPSPPPETHPRQLPHEPFPQPWGRPGCTLDSAFLSHCFTLRLPPQAAMLNAHWLPSVGVVVPDADLTSRLRHGCRKTAINNCRVPFTRWVSEYREDARCLDLKWHIVPASSNKEPSRRVKCWRREEDMAYVHKGKETIKAAMSNTSLVLVSLSLLSPTLSSALASERTCTLWSQPFNRHWAADARCFYCRGDDGWRTSLAKKILMIILLVFNVFFSFLPPAQNSFFPPFFVLSCTFSTHISKK